MEKSQIAAIIAAALAILFFIVLFQKNNKKNHLQDLKDEVLESKSEEKNFERAEQ